MPAIHARAMLFDLDGTLADSGDGVIEAWKIFAERHGYQAELFLERAHGRRTVEVMTEVAPELDAAQATIEVESILADLGATPTPGALELSSSMPPGSWAVVTSSTDVLAESRFRPPTGLQKPPVLVTAEDVSVGKPDPAGYLLAALRLGVEPADCVVVEDAPAGVAAGKAAGMIVVAVTTTHLFAELSAADFVVPGPASLALESAVHSNGGWLLTLTVRP